MIKPPCSCTVPTWIHGFMSLFPYPHPTVSVKWSESRLITPRYSFPVLYTPVSVSLAQDQWNREMSFTRRPGSERPRQTNRREIRHIIRNARVQPTAASATIQAQVLPSLGALCLLEPYEGAWMKDIWDRGDSYVYCP
ncbi:uncharacterized protein TNCV_2746271 [Trichonephila clavipes]|nr:uncharacterized protein TNCV_2746271 [Trichonephila clavipes]